MKQALVEELNAVKQSKADLLRELSKARAESKNAGETLTDREHQLSSLTDNLNKQIKKVNCQLVAILHFLLCRVLSFSFLLCCFP